MGVRVYNGVESIKMGKNTEEKTVVPCHIINEYALVRSIPY